MLDNIFIRTGEYYRVLSKIKLVFEMGYWPSQPIIKYTLSSYNKTNCLGHAVFNLPNKILDRVITNTSDYSEQRDVFSIDKENLTCKNIQRELYSRLKFLGLVIKPILKEETTSFGAWKIAFYYKKDKSDFHFLIQIDEEKDLWSHKISTSQKVETVNGLKDSLTIPSGEYLFYKTYKITNPNAKKVTDKLIDKIAKKVETKDYVEEFSHDIFV